MLELIFQGFIEWAYGLILESWQYFSTSLLDIMSLDFAYLIARKETLLHNTYSISFGLDF